ncbi:hypothetical protein NIES970_28520 (plasmid) [[Synechococcus] sp. NIES-970]|nr:hypothetical protein NIES970_28520 [[Synechococcus] sp. NIES-970]
MLHHLSLAAHQPARVAKVLAELMHGQFFEFPIHPGAYIAIANDAHGTAIEIFPADVVLIPGDEAVDASKQVGDRSNFTHVHAALSVPISLSTIQEIAAREGWICRFCDRGPFAVIEFWLENTVLLELLTSDMSDRYLNFMVGDEYAKFLAQVQAAPALTHGS